MAATVQNLKIMRRDTVPFTLTFKDQNAVAIDITGWTIFFTAKLKLKSTDDTEYAIKKTITIHADPIHGITGFTLSTTDTNLSGNYYYDIQIKKVDGTVITAMYGTISFLQDVTVRTTG